MKSPVSASLLVLALLFTNCKKDEIVEVGEQYPQQNSFLAVSEANSLSAMVNINVDDYVLPRDDVPYNLSLSVEWGNSYRIGGVVFDSLEIDLGTVQGESFSFHDSVPVPTEAYRCDYTARLMIQRGNVSSSLSVIEWNSLSGVEEWGYQHTFNHSPFTSLTGYTQGERGSAYLNRRRDMVISAFPNIYFGSDVPNDNDDGGGVINLQSLGNPIQTTPSEIQFPGSPNGGGHYQKTVAENEDYAVVTSCWLFGSQYDEVWLVEKGSMTGTLIDLTLIEDVSDKTYTWFEGVDMGSYAYFESLYTGGGGQYNRRILKLDYATEAVTHVKYYNTSDSSYNWNVLRHQYGAPFGAYGNKYLLHRGNNGDYSLYIFNETNIDWVDLNLSLSPGSQGYIYTLFVSEDELYLFEKSPVDGLNRIYLVRPDHTLEYKGEILADLSYNSGNTLIHYWDYEGVQNTFFLNEAGFGSAPTKFISTSGLTVAGKINVK